MEGTESTHHVSPVVPVYGEVGPVLVPQYEGRPVPGLRVAGRAVAGDGHGLSDDSHHLVLHH